ncbi:hypothetical protein EYF80_016499 [Liparis tanakae]|uniref:Uncharacterized protein n=1 Tax=Liparis tanakae TaxID=230148 RepID=A0A4Z2I5M1_9TELE|nr:hypothetical protein EYF80_016499 [Liparis tanakae]
MEKAFPLSTTEHGMQNRTLVSLVALVALVDLVSAPGVTLVNRPSSVVHVRRQRAHEQNPGDEAVEDNGHNEGDHIEQREVQEVDRHVEVPGDSVATRDDHSVGVDGFVCVP